MDNNSTTNQTNNTQQQIIAEAEQLDTAAANINTVVARPSLDRFIPLYYLVMAVWVGIGRTVFGSSGWTGLVTVFVYAPIILIFGMIVTAILSKRYKKSGYILSEFQRLIVIFHILSMFVYGLTVVDGADTADSASAAMNIFSTSIVTNDLSGILALLSQNAMAIIGVLLLVMISLPRKNRID